VHILGLLLLLVAFAQDLAWVVVAALVSGAGMGLLSPSGEAGKCAWPGLSANVTIVASLVQETGQPKKAK
jgi:hypothetical protein